MLLHGEVPIPDPVAPVVHRPMPFVANRFAVVQNRRVAITGAVPIHLLVVPLLKALVDPMIIALPVVVIRQVIAAVLAPAVAIRAVAVAVLPLVRVVVVAAAAVVQAEAAVAVAEDSCKV